MNKKGIGKILEAVIAILLVLSFIYFFTPKTEISDTDTPKNVEEAHKFILQQISSEKSLRDCAVDKTRFGDCSSCNNIDVFVRKNIPFGYNYACEICLNATTCTTKTLPLDKSLYTDSILISGNPSNRSETSKVIRIYFWGK